MARRRRHRGLRAQELIQAVARNATMDRDRKEQVRALLGTQIRRLLRRHRYPPERSAIMLVMDQAERLSGEVAA